MPNLSNVINTSAMFENAEVNTLDLTLLPLGQNFSMAKMFKGFSAESLILNNNPYSVLTNITSIFQSADIQEIQNLNSLGQSGTIKFFNKTFQRASIGDINLTNWVFTSALMVNKMFHNFRKIITLDINDIKNLRIPRSFFKAFSTHSRYQLICENATAIHRYAFNKLCPREQEDQYQYHRWAHKNRKLDNAWRPPIGTMKLVFTIFEENTLVQLPFKNQVLEIYWGDGEKTNNTLAQHTYSKPGVYYAVVLPSQSEPLGIQIDPTNLHLSWKKNLTEVESLGLINTDSTQGLFKDCINLRKFKLGGAHFGLITPLVNTSSMFEGASGLSSINLSNFITHSVSDINSMFKDAKSLRKLNVSGWDTSGVTNFESLFENCFKLERLDLAHFHRYRFKF